MKIFQNENWPGYYLMKDGSTSLLLKYRNSYGNEKEFSNIEIDMSEWIEITVPKN